MNAPSLPPQMQQFATRVNARVAELADAVPGRLRGPVGQLARRPGKQLRPMLLRACAGFGDRDEIRVVRLGALVELLHLASLLHDDLIDRTATRRGGPTAHVVLGTEATVLAGVACFAVAGMEAADLGEGVDVLVSQTVASLSYGELLDVERAFDIGLSLEDYLELVQRKTADLFRLSCLLGAAEARLDRDTATNLALFGLHIGVAFQILDDLLDFSDTDGGKPWGTDHLLGLFGAPTLAALAADTSGRLADLLLSADFGMDDMTAVRSLVIAYGGITAAVELARERHTRALALLPGTPDGPARAVLAGIADRAWEDRVWGDQP